MTKRNNLFFRLFIIANVLGLILLPNTKTQAQIPERSAFSGRIQKIQFDKTLQTYALEIALEDQVLRFEIDSSTQIRKSVRVDEIEKGDQIISDQNGSLLPVNFKSVLNPPKHPEDKRPPENPDQSRPQSMAPPPPNNETPQGPPPSQENESAMPPSDETQQQEQPSAPKKKPWEIEMENAVEPEDSLNLATHPLSQAEEAASTTETKTVEKTVLHQVEKVSETDNEIQLEAISENGKNETFQVPKEQLVYQIIGVEELHENSIIEIETAASSEKTKLSFITLLQ